MAGHGEDDTFDASKRPKITKGAINRYKPLEFAPPTFDEPRRTSVSQRSTLSLPLPLPPPPSFSYPGGKDKDEKSVSKLPKAYKLLEPPLRPQSPPNSTSPRGKSKATLGNIPIPPPLEIDERSSLIAHKKMRSALDTPLIMGLPFPQESSGSQSPKKRDGLKFEFERGVGPSPEKKGHPLPRIGYKGGLVDHAKALMARSTTDFSLWYEDTSATGRASTEAALQVRVMSIINRMPSSEVPLIPILPVAGRSPFSNVLTLTHIRDEEDGSKELLVLFASLQTSRTGGPQVGISDTQKIERGKTVRIWRPWSEIKWENQTVIMCSRFVVR